MRFLIKKWTRNRGMCVQLALFSFVVCCMVLSTSRESSKTAAPWTAADGVCTHELFGSSGDGEEKTLVLVVRQEDPWYSALLFHVASLVHRLTLVVMTLSLYFLC